MSLKVKLGVSNRHIHLSQQDMETLFGAGYQLHKVKELGQPGEFASDEKIDLVTEKATMKGIRVIGPVRKQTQVELAVTDARVLGLNPPVRESGDLNDSSGAKIVGPKGEIVLKEGIIIAARHLHLDLETAGKYGLKDQDIVKISIPGERAMTFDNVLVRAKATYAPEFHIDTDEANACMAQNDQEVEIIILK